MGKNIGKQTRIFGSLDNFGASDALKAHKPESMFNNNFMPAVLQRRELKRRFSERNDRAIYEREFGEEHKTGVKRGWVAKRASNGGFRS